MMKRAAIRLAEYEAKMFLNKASDFWKTGPLKNQKKHPESVRRSPEGAALKRQSMSLTRALSMMRRP
jgi:hypothetical protein